MKGKKHKPEQILKKLREADALLATGKTIGEICQQLEVSEQTFRVRSAGHSCLFFDGVGGGGALPGFGEEVRELFGGRLAEVGEDAG